MEFFVQFFKQASAVFTKLDSKQKIVVMFVSIFSVLLIVFLMTWTSERQFVVLSSNLQAEDAQRIVEYLDEQGIDYRLATEGTAILVPEGTEMDLRLEIAANGLITGGVVGYELFDRTNIGMTDFIQQVNYKRALEGELSRTIRRLKMVEMANVHIVVPKPSLFVEDEKPATAAVLLTLMPGQTLSAEQITTIARLVSSSVEGLQPANVQISDASGNDLSRIINKDPLMAAKSEQLRIQGTIELDYTARIEAIMAEALGPNNAIVSVSVDMDFTQMTATSKVYDPVTVVRAEERESTTGGVSDSVGQASSGERTTTNFEMNETITNIRDDYGKIRRITASVLVNGTYTDPDDPTTYQDRTLAELTTLRQSVINAVGIDVTGRGDQVSVDAYRFDRTVFREEADRLQDQERTELFQNIGKWSLMVVAFFLFIIVLRSVFRSLDLLLPKPKPKPAIDIEAEAIEEEISAEAQRRGQMLEQVSRFTKEKPANVASLLNTWLIEEKA